MTLKTAIKEEIERLIDHYEPYRPILDTPVAQKVRLALYDLLQFIDTLEEK
jgi:hypothetical protein